MSKDGSNSFESQTNQIFKLRDGRNLGYAEYGSLRGKPVFYFHGFPSSRLEAALFDQTAKGLDAHIISVDRPGMGLSTFKPGRKMLHFTDDVAELADQLNIARFAVVGMSGGAPYVSACAYKIPERLTGASIISGLAPIDKLSAIHNMIGETRLILWLGQSAPWLLKVLFAMAANRINRKRDLFFGKSLPYTDRVTLALPTVQDNWAKSISEAFRFGTLGPVWDTRLSASPWGFNPQEISIPIQLWHGELDRNVPVVIARRLANSIPKCQAKFYRDEGHFSLPFNYKREIISALVS